jgi:hypothetical protein
MHLVYITEAFIHIPRQYVLITIKAGDSIRQKRSGLGTKPTAGSSSLTIVHAASVVPL